MNQQSFRSLTAFALSLTSVLAFGQNASVEYGGEVRLDNQTDGYVQYDAADGVVSRTLSVDGYGLSAAHSFVGPGFNKAA